MEVTSLFCCDGGEKENVLKLLRRAKESFDALERDVEYIQYRGFRIVPNFSVSSIDYAITRWMPRQSDVFVASFPKTGTNWTVEIIRHLLYPDKEQFKMVKELPLAMQFLEAGNSEKFKLLDKFSSQHRRLIFTHLPSDLFNVEAVKRSGAKIVYVLRNPKDQIVSWYHFYHNLPKAQTEPTKSMLFNGWDCFFNNYVKGKFYLYNRPGEWYPEHILSWLRYRDHKFVYFLFYENLYLNLEKEIEKLADFLGVPLEENAAKDIASKCTLDSMKTDMKVNQDGQLAQVHNVILRKGEVGGWKDYFTAEQSTIVDDIFRQKLAGTDIRFIESVET